MTGPVNDATVQSYCCPPPLLLGTRPGADYFVPGYRSTPKKNLDDRAPETQNGDDAQGWAVKVTTVEVVEGGIGNVG